MNIKIDMVNKETRLALQKLAREQLKRRILQDVLFDINICKLEGWNPSTFVLELENLLHSVSVNFRRGK